MRKIIYSVATLAFLCGSVNAAEYALDKAHSNVGFKIKHMGVSTTNGKFKEFDGVIDAEGEKLNKLSGVIKTASVDTANEMRDKHLSAPDFFDSDKFPEMKFEMSEFKGDKVIGNLTIKDVTKAVEFDYDFGGSTTDQKGKEHIGFSLEGKIKRSDFNFAPNSSTAMLGDDIKISIDIEAIK
ncbi:MAG: YceI family protein [Campylobacter sp.]|nr:YceI family protein [Campylobacter sp.]MBQ7675424.1 YceI family protein [Campylobacter sp.]